MSNEKSIFLYRICWNLEVHNNHIDHTVLFIDAISCGDCKFTELKSQ